LVKNSGNAKVKTQMKKSRQSKKRYNFLQDFIAGEMYLQNPPIETDKFIKFCKKRGIKTSKDELEFFEKEKLLFPIIRIERPVGDEERIKFKKEDGNEYWRPAKGGLLKGETEIERYKVKYYSSYGFSEHNKDLLLNWVKEGNLFDPATKEFQSWDTFLDEELEGEKQKIVSFYSSFQIYWLEKIKLLNLVRFNYHKTDFDLGDCSLSTENGRVFLNTNICLKREISDKEKIPLSGGKTYKPLDHKEALIDEFRDRFNLEKKKERLGKSFKEFNKILKFLLSIQSIYFPYAKSGGRTIQITGDGKKWHEAKLNFKLELVLNKIGLRIEDIAEWYKIVSDKAQDLLGIKRDDWIQLWKNIAWREKDELEGSVRLGVEYLQWAVMLKRIMEEHRQKEILDIDEMHNVPSNDILRFDPQETLRGIRNRRYSDNVKNYYHDCYKRLFYLANDFGLDYQPRITVFVEGKTEETVFPEVFEWFVGQKPDNRGIEFINFRGVDKLLSTAKNAEKLRTLLTELQKEEKQQIWSKRKNSELNQVIKNLKNIDIVISNWTSFLSYNLEKWQIIPFFMSDNEGNIKHFLEAEKPIRFEGQNYDIPENWRYIWGVSNENNPFEGKNFEMANFSDEEIATVLSKILNKEIKPEDVNKLRRNNQGIKQIDGSVDAKKVDIAVKLFENLKENYSKTEDQTIFERPIFKVISKITNLAVLNHPPVDREIEMKNKEYIEKELGKTLPPSSAKPSNPPKTD
jgi:hypothetical protein